MITHSVPCGDAASKTASAGAARVAWARAPGARKRPAGVNQGRHGPLRLPLHLAPRYEGPGVDPGAVPRGARARRLRGPLLLSDARPARARRRRQCVAQGNRDADRTLSALFGGARAVVGSALRHERGVEDRRRGQGDPHRTAQESRQHQGRGRLRRSRPQVSDLGARTLPRGTRGGHREGSRAHEAAGLPGSGGRPARSTGMMASRDSGRAVAGGLARHIPVLGRHTVEFLSVRAGGIYIDATFGAGGHTRDILAAANCNVIGIDRDQSAIARGADLVRAGGSRLVLVEDKFSNLQAVARGCGYDAVDGVVFDLGVSSMQLDEAARGFSFRHEGPLDMRMSRDGPTAADVVASASERELAAIVAAFGEERHARRVARAIVAARRAAPIRTTRALAEVIAGVVPARGDAIHPATRTFQALRIFVNDELTELAAGLAAAERVLKSGGRMVVLAFHSLEDRITKSFLVERSRPSAPSRHRPAPAQLAATFRILTPRPIVPDEAEISANPRARSAKLRAAERTDAAIPARRTTRLPPRLPSLAELAARLGTRQQR